MGLEYMIPLSGYWPSPDVISPENNAVMSDKIQHLYLGAAEKLTHYTIQLATNSDFSSLILTKQILREHPIQLRNLNAETTYYWRVRGHNATGPSNWSEVRRFSTGTGSEHAEIYLQPGWNIISSNIYPDNPSIDNIFNGLGNNLVQVKDSSDRIYSPQSENNTLHEWDYTEGYFVYVDNSDILTIYGDKIQPESTPLQLNEGWNLVPYLRKSPMSINDALSTIIDKIYLIKNNAGEHYWPDYNVDTIEQSRTGPGVSDIP
jgi:hypothetical protein